MFQTASAVGPPRCIDNSSGAHTSLCSTSALQRPCHECAAALHPGLCQHNQPLRWTADIIEARFGTSISKTLSSQTRQHENTAFQVYGQFTILAIRLGQLTGHERWSSGNHIPTAMVRMAWSPQRWSQKPPIESKYLAILPWSQSEACKRTAGSRSLPIIRTHHDKEEKVQELGNQLARLVREGTQVHTLATDREGLEHAV